MSALQEIKITLSNHKPRLFHDSQPIKSIAIFGYYSRREHNDSSDLDILFEFSDKVGIRFVDLTEDLESLTGLKVDLVSEIGSKVFKINRFRFNLCLSVIGRDNQQK